MALSPPTHRRVTPAVNWNKTCNKKTVETSDTVLTQKTVTTCVTPFGRRARRCRDEDRDRIASTSDCLVLARLEQKRNCQKAAQVAFVGTTLGWSLSLECSNGEPAGSFESAKAYSLGISGTDQTYGAPDPNGTREGQASEVPVCLSECPGNLL